MNDWLLPYSTIIPAFNAPEPDLSKAITSVLTQDFPPSEIIVVDDGSESPPEISSTFSSAPIRIVRQDNGGFGSAINRGITESTHEVLSFLDHDDQWLPGKSATQLRQLSADCPVVLGDTLIVDERPPAIRQRLVEKSRVFGAGMFHKSVFDIVGLLTEDGLTGEPIEWWSRFQTKDLAFGYVNQIVLRRRIHGKNLGITRPESSTTFLLHRIREHLRTSGNRV